MGFFFHVGVGSWSFFLSPSLKVVVFSLGSGRVHSTVFLEPFAFLFLYPLRLFRQLLGVIPFGSGFAVPQVVLLLSLTPGVVAPCLSVSEPAVPAFL